MNYFFPDMHLRNTSDKEKLELADVDMYIFRRSQKVELGICGYPHSHSGQCEETV